MPPRRVRIRTAQRQWSTGILIVILLTLFLTGSCIPEDRTWDMSTGLGLNMEFRPEGDYGFDYGYQPPMYGYRQRPYPSGHGYGQFNNGYGQVGGGLGTGMGLMRPGLRCRGAPGEFSALRGIDGWCQVNCEQGYCPSSHCMCF